MSYKMRNNLVAAEILEAKGPKKSLDFFFGVALDDKVLAWEGL